MTETTASMITINSRPYGEIRVSEAQLVHFPDGLFGFPQNRNYALLDTSEDSAFKWLQNLENHRLAFLVIQPQLVLENYSTQSLQSELWTVDLPPGQWEDLLVFALVTIPGGKINEMTLNLQGPLMINRRKKLGRQVISPSEDHGLQVRVLSRVS